MVVNIFLMKEKASEILSARKKIQQKVARPNVSTTWKNSFKEGSILPCATMSRLFLLVFITIEGIMNKAFRNPQKMKVQFAPCQKPLTKKMIKVLRIRIQSPPLLPPRGM